MLPGGKLYVPGAEKIIPNIRRLVDEARAGRVFLVSSGDAHAPDDPEFKVFPPHCVKGTPRAPRLFPIGLACRKAPDHSSTTRRSNGRGTCLNISRSSLRNRRSTYSIMLKPASWFRCWAQM